MSITGQETSTSRGPCAKRRVFCTIVTQAGLTFVGENDCANPQPTCPRLPGEGYEKCASICQQAGHAEIQALRQIQNCPAPGVIAKGASAFIEGHYWVCEACGRALRDAGLQSITIELEA